MAESSELSDPTELELDPTLLLLDLLSSSSGPGPNSSSKILLSNTEKLVSGLQHFISTVDPTLKTDSVEDIVVALKLIGCPFELEPTHVEDLNCSVIYLVLLWIVSEAGFSERLKDLASLLTVVKALENQVSDFESDCCARRSKMLSEIADLEEKMSKDDSKTSLLGHLDRLICESSKSLECSKKVLASKLREFVFLRRQLDQYPIHPELVQYERRFSELDVHMQDKLLRTRKYYATYNALIEIKELMLKEISLLNSVDSQFQDVFGNPVGRAKLIESMETILQGTRQKHEKVKPGLDTENKAVETLREQYGSAIANQRRCSGLLTAFQEEYRKNERLKAEFAKCENREISKAENEKNEMPSGGASS